MADMFVIGLQEIVGLTGANYVFRNDGPVKEWRKLLTGALETLNRASCTENMTVEEE